MPVIEFEVFCNQCGKGLCKYTTVTGTAISVDPCPDCIESTRDKAFNDGWSEGYEKGESNANNSLQE